MSSARLRQRIPITQIVGQAYLCGYTMRCTKRGKDGTGKANLHLDPAGIVWGVLYQLTADALTLLDTFEPNYAHLAVTVQTSDPPSTYAALTYISTHLLDTPCVTRTYHAYLLAGAHEHQLPADYIAGLAAIPLVAD
ncbi:MAG: gamma-glutamylcyclotransferase [Chloroflexaceae bacterium]|nr:gamma-glutamylcyclotransferase [Chloroflexaceae bacterium]